MSRVKRYACIMAGGVGKRFWPLSRREKPKHLLSVVGSDSLLQQTATRLLPQVGPDNLLIVTNARQVDQVVQQLPKIKPGQILAEPHGRNTAACIGLCLRWLILRGEEDSMVGFFPSDHLISDTDAFSACMETAWEEADNDSIITFGVRPSRPETGYGYIEAACGLKHHTHAMEVVGFHEKPDRETAEEWLADGRYFWNAGMFVARVRVLWTELERFLPETTQLLVDLGDSLSYNELRDKAGIYASLPNISIDYGVMERTDALSMIVAEFPWDDLGSWEAASGYWPEQGCDNRYVGDSVTLIDSQGCRVRAGKRLIGLVGMEDVIVIDTEEALLVCPRDRAQDVKRLVEFLEEKKLARYL